MTLPRGFVSWSQGMEVVQRYETLARAVGMGDAAWHRQVPKVFSAFSISAETLHNH